MKSFYFTDHISISFVVCCDFECIMSKIFFTQNLCFFVDLDLLTILTCVLPCFICVGPRISCVFYYLLLRTIHCQARCSQDEEGRVRLFIQSEELFLVGLDSISFNDWIPLFSDNLIALRRNKRSRLSS